MCGRQNSFADADFRYSDLMILGVGFDEERSTQVRATKCRSAKRVGNPLKKSPALRSIADQSEIKKSAGKIHLPMPIFYFAVIFSSGYKNGGESGI